MPFRESSRRFMALRPALRYGIPLLALGQGLSEAGFILSARWGLTGAGAAALLGLSAFALARFIFQDSGAVFEARALRETFETLQGRLLETLRARAVPAYRPDHRRELARALEETVPRAAEGLLARRRFTGSLLQAAILVPGLFLLSWKLAMLALALAAIAWSVLRWKNRSLKALERAEAAGKIEGRHLREEFENGLEAAAGAAHGDLLRTFGHAWNLARLPEWNWRRAQARYPALLETGFFFALAGLVLMGASALEGMNNWILFSGLLLLAYRPVREAARHYPVALQGAQALRDAEDLIGAWNAWGPRALPPDNPSPGFFALDRVDFAYETGHPVFRAFSAEFESTLVTGITGPNGGGKTTLLRLLSGAETAKAGTVRWTAAARRTGIAYLPQRAHPGADWADWARALKADRPELWAQLEKLLRLERLTVKAAHPEALAGGERQRMALARVLASDAAFLLLDEPTTALPGDEREDILAGALALWKSGGGDARGGIPNTRGALIVSHEPFLKKLCDTVLEIRREDAVPARRTA